MEEQAKKEIIFFEWEFRRARKKFVASERLRMGAAYVRRSSGRTWRIFWRVGIAKARTLWVLKVDGEGCVAVVLWGLGVLVVGSLVGIK